MLRMCSLLKPLFKRHVFSVHFFHCRVAKTEESCANIIHHVRLQMHFTLWSTVAHWPYKDRSSIFTWNSEENLSVFRRNLNYLQESLRWLWEPERSGESVWTPGGLWLYIIVFKDLSGGCLRWVSQRGIFRYLFIFIWSCFASELQENLK